MKAWKRISALIAGATFVAAAVAKLKDPPAFAHQIHNFQLLPQALLNPLALVLPWMEAITGVALIAAGLMKRPLAGAARWAVALLAMFTAALAINLWRGHPVDCGCFGAGAAKDAAGLMRDMAWAIARDAALILLCLPLVRARAV